MDLGQARACADEFDAMRRRFRGMARRWGLSRAEAAALVGCTEIDLALFLGGYRPLRAGAETRVRLLLDLGDSLDRLLPLTTGVAEWLRIPVEDCGGEAPLAFLRGPTAGVRSLRDGLAAVLAGEF